jgi:hypothetical protein
MRSQSQRPPDTSDRGGGLPESTAGDGQSLRRSTPRAPLDLARLKTVPVDELRALWVAHMGRARPPVQRRLLVRELAWRTQARSQGGFDADTQRLLTAAMRSALKAMREKSRSSDDEAPQEPAQRRPHGSRSRARAKPTQLPSTSRLIRMWHGIRHEVTVLEAGRLFRYRDRTFTSLTAIAREITGSGWSGPRFFGLTVKQTSEDPDGAHPPKTRTPRSQGGQP